MQPRSAFLIACVVLLTALAGCSGSSDGGVIGTPWTITVGPSGTAHHTSIQDAVNAAPAGSTIAVEPGTYSERVYIDKRLTIIGSGPETVVEFPAGGPLDSAVIEIRDVVGVRIEALKVQGVQPDVDGIRVRGATSVVLDSVVASNNSMDGVDIKNSRGVDFIDGVFESNGQDGVQVDIQSGNVKIISCRAASNAGDGFKIRDSIDVLLESSNSTLNNDDGILVRDSSGVRIVGNSSSDNTGWGISINYSPDTTLEGNTTLGNGAGNLKCDPGPCP